MQYIYYINSVSRCVQPFDFARTCCFLQNQTIELKKKYTKIYHNFLSKFIILVWTVFIDKGHMGHRLGTSVTLSKDKEKIFVHVCTDARLQTIFGVRD